MDPLHIYAAWPAWMLNAAIEALPRVAAVESMQTAEAVQVGNGNMKPSTLRNVQNQWRREARGQTGNGAGALSQLNMLAAMALRQGGIRCRANLAKQSWSSRPTPRG